MRFPRASAVVVALSTFVAVATVAALASQLVPFDRAGAVLPDGPITIDGQPVDSDPLDGATPSGDPSDSGDDPGGATNGGDATVVAPAPAETVDPGPDPEPEPEPEPSSPGNSGNAPGLTDKPDTHGDPPGPGKP